MRNKKYNPKKYINKRVSAQHNLFKATFSKIGIVCNLIDMDKSSLYIPSGLELPKLRKDEILKRLFEHKHDWTVYCAVCIREPNGKDNLKTIDLGVTAQVRFEDIAGIVEKEHKEFLYSFEKRLKHVCGYGFIAFPNSEEKSNELLMTAFQEAECFNNDYMAHMNESGDIEFIQKAVEE